MSRYFVSHRHDHAPHTFVPGEIDGSCSIRVAKISGGERGIPTQSAVFEALGQCALDGEIPGAWTGFSGDLYAAKMAINAFLGGHDGVNTLHDARGRQFTNDVIEQVVAAQFDGELPFPGAPVAADAVQPSTSTAV